MRRDPTSVCLACVLLLVVGCAQEEEGTAATTVSEAAPTATPQEAAHNAVLPSTCERLTDVLLDGVSIESAAALEARMREVAGPIPQTVRVDVPHCRVTGVIDSTIRFELLLPDDWNGKFMMGGGGAWVGWIENQAQDWLSPGSTPLDLGYATAGTDTGHQASFNDASWALNNQKAKEDFAHVAVHRTTEVSKAIIADFYEEDIDYSYFFGCSRGGGQALIEAQRYPQDFDGLIAGAPARDWTGMTAGMIQNQQAVFPDPNELEFPRFRGHFNRPA